MRVHFRIIYCINKFFKYMRNYIHLANDDKFVILPLGSLSLRRARSLGPVYVRDSRGESCPRCRGHFLTIYLFIYIRLRSARPYHVRNKLIFI